MYTHAPTPTLAKENGAYYTPLAVADSLVRFAVRTPADRLLDPACGDGRFIALHANSVGVERDLVAAEKACERAPNAKVYRGDFFHWAETTHERFDCAAGNPPFIRYQLFAGETRGRALRFCRSLGVSFSGLTSSWAPFLVAAAALLRQGGRLAFVVPASIGHAPHAAPLIEYLVHHFSTVRILAVRKKLFPHLSEDCWVLFADGFGGATEHIEFIQVDCFNNFEERLALDSSKLVPVREWRDQWRSRLRPYLLDDAARSLYHNATQSKSSVRLGEIASVGIGYVTGDNSFFHLRPSEIEHWRVPAELIHPTVRNSRSLPSEVLSSSTVEDWRQSNQPAFLLRIPKCANLPPTVQSYLNSTRGEKARRAYKCRSRTPWYSVPDVRIPTFFLTYMSGEIPSLVRNDAAATCTNALHAVHLNNGKDADRLLQSWRSPYLKLSCEIEGHPLGGGMLKLEPKEAARLLIPPPRLLPFGSEAEVHRAIRTLRGWRHYD